MNGGQKNVRQKNMGQKKKDSPDSFSFFCPIFFCLTFFCPPFFRVLFPVPKSDQNPSRIVEITLLAKSRATRSAAGPSSLKKDFGSPGISYSLRKT
jgi:hypothetical protein